MKNIKDYIIESIPDADIYWVLFKIKDDDKLYVTKIRCPHQNTSAIEERITKEYGECIVYTTVQQQMIQSTYNTLNEWADSLSKNRDFASIMIDATINVINSILE